MIFVVVFTTQGRCFILSPTVCYRPFVVVVVSPPRLLELPGRLLELPGRSDEKRESVCLCVAHASQQPPPGRPLGPEIRLV